VPQPPSPGPRRTARPRPGRRAATATAATAPWVNNLPSVSGSVASFNGRNWTANQWNYGEVPGGASGAWADNGAC
jgi:hypothetical protein